MIIAAIVGAVMGLDPSRTWTHGEDPSGAPAAVGEDLTDARRAAGEANSTANLLTNATGQLVDGTGEASTAIEELSTGLKEATTGANALSDGMVQLQAGVGQLGDGATQIANGVDLAVEPVIALNAARGQIVEAMNRALTELEDADDPRLVQAREDLLSVRDQAQAIPEDAIDELLRLQEGARELSNQLDVPGYAFHDGVYEATNGAEALHEGLAAISAAVGESEGELTTLVDGVESIDHLANQTQEKVSGVSRALPAPVYGTEEEPVSTSLSPQIALLIAAMVMGIGMITGALSSRRVVLIAGVLVATVTGLVALFVLATGLSVAAALISSGLLALAALVGVGTSRVLVGLAGPTWGMGIASGLGIVQLGLVGWLWRIAMTSSTPTWAQVLADLTPLQWATTSLTAIGNAGDAVSLWTGVAVLGVLAILGVVGGLAAREVPARARV